MKQMFQDASERRRKMCKNKERKSDQGVAIALGLAVLLGITGCAGKEAEMPQEDILAEADGQWDVSDAGTQENTSEKKAVANESEDIQDGEEGTDAPEKQAKADGEMADLQEDGDRTLNAAQGTEHLGGKVQSVQADGMTFAHTSLVDEDGMVTLLDVEDAEKIAVKFMEDTKLEHWTIQGGGAGIDMQNAAVSDLKEGMGVELEGYFDGDSFVAARVIMEEYK